MKLLLLFLLSLPLVAQTFATPTQNKIYWTSVATVTASQVLDIHSSVGKYELNPIAQSANGTFDTRKGILIKSAFLVTVFTVQWAILRKRPDWKDELSIFNFGVSAVTFPVVIHNYHVPRIR